MADKTTIPERDKTLINILERIGGELQRQGLLLEDIVKSQGEVSQAMHSTGYQLSSQHSESERTYEKISDSISRYRTDMLSLVNEQDHISESLKELRKVFSKLVFSTESNSNRLEELEGRLKVSEKAIRDHNEASQKQADMIPKEFADVRQNESRLHADTEKRLGELHRETQRQIDKLNQETSRRLLILEAIEEALETLLIRTEPPEKKPFFFLRFFKRVGFFFRIKLPFYFKQMIGALRKNKE